MCSWLRALYSVGRLNEQRAWAIVLIVMNGGKEGDWWELLDSGRHKTMISGRELRGLFILVWTQIDLFQWNLQSRRPGAGRHLTCLIEAIGRAKNELIVFEITKYGTLYEESCVTELVHCPMLTRRCLLRVSDVFSFNLTFGNLQH